MSQKNELKELSSVVGANLLDHYLSSMQESLVQALATEDKLQFSDDKIRYRRQFLASNLSNLHKLVALLSGNAQTRKKLRYHINLVIKDIRDPFFYQPLYEANMTNLLCAITTAFEGNFGRKEDVQLQTLLVILSKVSLMRDQVMIPEKFRRMLENWDNMDS